MELRISDKKMIDEVSAWHFFNSSHLLSVNLNYPLFLSIRNNFNFFQKLDSPVHFYSCEKRGCKFSIENLVVILSFETSILHFELDFLIVRVLRWPLYRDVQITCFTKEPLTEFFESSTAPPGSQYEK